MNQAVEIRLSALESDVRELNQIIAGLIDANMILTESMQQLNDAMQAMVKGGNGDESTS